MIDKVSGLRMGNDVNRQLIEMFKALQVGWRPPTEISEDYYTYVRTHQNTLPPELVAHVMINCAFGAMWGASVARGKDGRNYAQIGANNLLKQRDFLKGVVFSVGTYDSMYIPKNSVIYCDPPYFGVTGYKNKFDSLKFYDWCRKKAREGHHIFLSEYSAPSDFECVWEKKVTLNIVNTKGSKQRTEKLFKINY